MTHSPSLSLMVRYNAAATFQDFLDSATTNSELWRAMAARADGDAINTLPVLAALANRAVNVDLRVLSSENNSDLMDAHLTGSSRSIPVVMLLDANYVECKWWGPRPSPLQGWVIKAGSALTKEDRYREVRRWYARDRGTTTLAELVAVLRAACATQAA